MLHPTDQAFLAAAVRVGAVAAGQAGGIAGRYQGPPGGLGDALVQAGLLSPQARDQLWLQLSADPGTARIGDARADTKQFGEIRPASGRFGTPLPTPPSARFGATPPSTPSQRLRLPGRTPEIPGYTITKELGRGGMGAVYLANRDADGTQVAIKVLLNAGERQIARFERELQALERLRHPNVVPLLEAGQVNGKPFIVLAFVEGGDLHEALEEGDLDRRAAIGIVAKVARAIAHAHTLDILHRDLKPANVLLDKNNEPRVTDFGLAKILDRETQLTKTHATLGTPQYMAPEQVTGETYTPAVDTYALGVMLYEIVTHELPFQESGVALFRQIREERPPRPWDVSDVDKDLGKLILWALEKAPADRPRCIDLANALESYLSGEAVELGGPAASRARARPILIGLGVLALALALVAGGLGVARWRRTATQAAAEEAALTALQSALGEARRARKGADLSGLLAEVGAYRRVEELLAAVPAARRAEAESKVDAAKARPRRAEVLRLAVPLLIEADRGAEAIALAREHAAIAKGPAAELVLARAEATDPASAAAARRRVEALIQGELTPALRAELAQTLLHLHLPRVALRLLAQAPAEQLALRAQAHLQRGDLVAARTDLLNSLRRVGRDVAVSIELARLEGRLGKPERGLKQLDALKAGSDPRWHAARGELLTRLARPGAAKLAYEQALKTATQNTGVLTAVRVRRGRFHLTRGRRLEAEADLQEVNDPAALLDLAVSRWIGGGPQAAAREALAEVIAAADRLAATPRLSAAAARWQARFAIAEDDRPGAKAAAAKAWALDPSSLSADTRAWVALRTGDLAGARQAINESPSPPPSKRRLLVRIALAGGDTAAAQALLRGVGAESDATLQLLQLLATPMREGSREARAERVYRLQQRGRSIRAVGVPVASEQAPGAQPRDALVARLYHEARILQARLQGRRDAPAQGRAEALLRRVIGIEPDHFAARIDLARISSRLDPLAPVIARAPTLVDARRTRINVNIAQQGQGGRALRDVTTFPGDLALLLEAPDLRVSERLAFARLLLRRGDAGKAWRVLEPALNVTQHRILAAFQFGVQLARRVGKESEAKRCAGVVAEIKRTIEGVRPLLETANVGDDISTLDEASRALRQIARDLPKTAYYYRLRAQLRFGQGNWVHAMLDGGEYVALQRGLTASQPSLWLYGFGWTAASPQELVPRTAREQSQARPDAPGPWIAQALFYGARFYLKAPRDPEDSELAADRALRALHLQPASAGAAALAANLLLSAGDQREAVALIDHALALDPKCTFAVMQQARLAAFRKQPKQTLDHLRQLNTAGRTLRKQLSVDDSFDAVRGHPDVVEFFKERGIELKKE